MMNLLEQTQPNRIPSVMAQLAEPVDVIICQPPLVRVLVVEFVVQVRIMIAIVVVLAPCQTNSCSSLMMAFLV